MLVGGVSFQECRAVVDHFAVHAEGSAAECGRIYHRCSIGCWKACVGQNQRVIPDERGLICDVGIGVVIGRTFHEMR